jgi:hypothetical protein
MEGVTGKPADREVHLRFAHQASIVHDPEKKAGEHQANANFRINAGATLVDIVQACDFLTQPTQIEHPINTHQNVVVREELSERSDDEQLRLAPIFLPQHLAAPRRTPPKPLKTESHEARFFNSPRVHWMRNALAHVPKGQHTMVAAAIRQAFLQTDAEAAHQTWRHVADQLRPRWPKLATLMDDSEHDVLAYIGFPGQHRTKLHSTNPLERLNKEVKRRADVVSIFPNEASITRLIGAVLLEQNDEWLLQCRYMQIEGMAELTLPLLDADPAKLPPVAA